MNIRRILLILFAVIYGLTASAQHRGGTIYRLGNGEYCARVKTDWFIDDAATQQNENWCWAACIQMVLSYQGVDITQDDSVTSVYGWAAARGGNTFDIVNGANNCGRGLRAKAEQPSGNSKMSFIDDLAKRYPPSSDFQYRSIMWSHLRTNRNYIHHIV